MSGYCTDCGCRTSNGICSNCQEEFYIETFQAEYMNKPFSDSFQQKAREQEAYIHANPTKQENK